MTTPFYTPTDASAIPASSVSSQPAKKAPIAPWIGEGGFVPIPREFYLFALPQLSKGAAQQFEYHCANAMTSGKRAGFSYCYRETMASKRKKSLSSVDRANAELEEKGMIRDTGRRYRHGGAVMFEIMPPSKWLFDECKNAPSPSQKVAGKDAKMRPITKDNGKIKTKKQQTPLRAENVVVVDSQSENVSTSEPQPNTALQTKLEAQGVSARVAAMLVRDFDEKRIAVQLVRIDGRKYDDRAATLIASIKGNWEAPHRQIRQGAAPKPCRANASSLNLHVRCDDAPLPTKAATPKPPEAPKNETGVEKTGDIAPDKPDSDSVELNGIGTDKRPEPVEVRPDAACDVVFAALDDDLQTYMRQETHKRAPGDGVAASARRLELKREFVWTHCREQVMKAAQTELIQ